MEMTMEQDWWAKTIHDGMGTKIMHKAYGRLAHRAVKAAQRELIRLERLFSRFNPKSEVSKINRMAGMGTGHINREVFSLLRRAQSFSTLSEGAFDITVGPLVKLWDYQLRTGAPDAAEIEKTLSLVGFGGLKLHMFKSYVQLETKGQWIDLGGIGKGYASDRAMAVFRRYGIKSALTNIGGNVSALGAKPDGSLWQVGIRHPRQEDALIGVINVKDKAVVTSGDYERFFADREGKRYHHLLDPRTGYPAESGLISVTIIADSAMTADALSTAMFVSGLHKSGELMNKFPDVQAVLVDQNLGIHITKGLQGIFETREKYEVI